MLSFILYIYIYIYMTPLLFLCKLPSKFLWPRKLNSLLLLLYPFLLLNKSPASKPFLLMLKSQQGQVKVRRSCPQPRTLTPKTPLQSRMWSLRLRKSSLSLKLRMQSSRQLIPRMALTQQRSSCRIFYLFFYFLSFCHFLLL